MSLKIFKPYTKSTRGTILVDKSGLWKGKPYKPLTSVNNASKGRNNAGRITSKNHGGGHKQRYRHIDFYRKKFSMKAEVEWIEYDPNRSCYIMLVKFEDGKTVLEVNAELDVKSSRFSKKNPYEDSLKNLYDAMIKEIEKF